MAADEVWVVQLDTKQVQAAAPAAAKAVEGLEAGLDRLTPAAGRARDAIGRFISAGSGGAQVFRGAADGVYELADAYDLLPSKGDAYRDSLIRVREANDAAAAAARQQLAEQAALKGLMEGQSPVALRASDATQKYAKSIQAAGGAAGRGGAAGNILLFSQIVDDAQYGFRAIVNQFPQLGIAAAQTFGFSTQAGMKFGGALGLIGVAINQNIKNIEEWRDLIKDVAGQSFYQPIVDGWNAITFATERAAKAAERVKDAQRVKDAEKARTAIEGITTPEQQAAAKAFKAAVEKGGGGKELLNQIVSSDRAANPGRSKEDQEKAERNLYLLTADALGGQRGAIDEVIRRAGGENKPLGRAFTNELAEPARKAGVKEYEEQQKRDQEEAAAHNEARAKDIEDTAKTLAGGSLGTSALTVDAVDANRVRETLATSGQDVGQEYAVEIAQKLQEVIAEQVSTKAQAEGITPEAAKGELRDERLAKIKADAEAQEKERKAEAEANVAKAKEGGADILAGAGAKAGGNAKQIARYLQAQGFDVDASKSLAEDAAKDYQRSQLQEQLSAKPKSVETFSSTSAYLEKVQQAVGGPGDTAQKQLQEQVQTNMKLQLLLENTRKFGFGDTAGSVF